MSKGRVWAVLLDQEIAKRREAASPEEAQHNSGLRTLKLRRNGYSGNADAKVTTRSRKKSHRTFKGQNPLVIPNRSERRQQVKAAKQVTRKLRIIAAIRKNRGLA